MQKFDIVIKNGHVIDPMNQIDQKNCNIAIHEGKIAQIGGRGCQLDNFVFRSSLNFANLKCQVVKILLKLRPLKIPVWYVQWHCVGIADGALWHINSHLSMRYWSLSAAPIQH